MNEFKLFILKLMFLSALKCLHGSILPNYSYDLFIHSLAEGKSEEFQRSLKYYGGFALTDLPEYYYTSARKLKINAIGCLDRENSQTYFTHDGFERFTFAASQENAFDYPFCIEEEGKEVKKVFDRVDKMITNLIIHMSRFEDQNWFVTEATTYQALYKALSKDHINVYKATKKTDVISMYTQPFLNDDGLFILTIHDQSTPLTLYDSNGESLSTNSLQDNSLLVFITEEMQNILFKKNEVTREIRSVSHRAPSLHINGINNLTTYTRIKVFPRTEMFAHGDHTDENDNSNAKCTGSMDMMMGGFETFGNKKNPCIILFFKPFTLSSSVKFGFGCVCVLLMGFLIEALIFARRKVSTSPFFARNARYYKMCVMILLFALNLILGYLAMLVAMTYSVELFMCGIMGMVIGHAIFNLDAQIGETVDPCCTGQNAVSIDDIHRYEHFQE